MKRILSLILLFSLLLCGCEAVPEETKAKEQIPQATSGIPGNVSADKALTDAATEPETDSVAVPGGKNTYTDIQLGWGSEVLFGSYEQDNNLDNGPEAIRWLVLDVTDNGILLQSKYCLDAIPFALESDVITSWLHCYARRWLNGEFYNTAFSEKERASILLTDVWNNDLNGLSGEYTADTQDYVFLMSEAEYWKYFTLTWGTSGHFYDADRRAMPTAYAIAQGIQVEDGRSGWYLRDIHELPGYWSAVGTDRLERFDWEDRADKGWLGVRPMIWISHNADFTLVQTSAADPDPDISRCFPEDWKDRYVIRNGDGCVEVYCKAAYESSESEKSWLFSVYYHNGELVLPDYYSVGMYDEYIVEATLPWSVPEFSDEAIAAEYTDMIYDVGDIFETLKDRVAEMEHYRQLYAYGYDMSMYMGSVEGMTGVYRLDSSGWTEQSKESLISPTNPHSFISISPDGNLFISYGRDVYTGFIRVMTDRGAAELDEPNCLVVLEDNIIRPAYYYQGALTIHNMPQYDLLDPDGNGNTSSTLWTYCWEDANFWTGDPNQNDIG